MKHLVRSELDQAEERGLVGNLMNNTWVLIGMLVLIILGGVWWYEQRDLTPEQLFAKGQALMRSEDLDDWKQARASCFDPLLKLDRETWEPRVREYLTMIEVESSQRPSSRRISAGEAEPNRLLNLARDLHSRREFTRAELVLRDLSTLLQSAPGDDPKLLAIAQGLLARWEQERQVRSGNSVWLEQSLATAQDALDRKQPEDAARLCQAIIRLYQDDLLFQDQVKLARELLKKTESIEKSPSSAPSTP